jgi:hypothetical protein
MAFAPRKQLLKNKGKSNNLVMERDGSPGVRAFFHMLWGEAPE